MGWRVSYLILFRPVGLRELELVAAAGWQEYPPRLRWQPIFYPVVTREYAHGIVMQWNSNFGQLDGLFRPR